MTFSPEGSWFAAGGAGRTLLWRLDQESAPRESRLNGLPTALAFSLGGSFLAIGKEKEAWLWNLSDNSERKVSADAGQTVTSFAFDSTNSQLAIGWNKGRVGIFPLEGEGILDAPPSLEAAITALAFSPDGRWLAMADANGKAFLWSPKMNGMSLGSQDKKIRILAFSRDGHQIASGGQDGTLQLWSFDGERSPGPPVVWKGHDSQILALSFTADGKELISTGSNDTVRHWPLQTEDLIRLACQKAGRNLTKEEWESNVPPGEAFKKGTPCGSLLP
ncbi:MAG: hypothetical protein DMF53_12170 [Acidobacteria bacterium]|nr:MAG: hypothetical protein DMF53_12170 [Acidobacteriota bacterium]